MDKQTLSNYGLLTVVTLILAVMLAFATPFGTYVGDGVVSVANGLVGTSNKSIDEDNISNLEKQWSDKLNNNINNGGNNNVSGNIDLSTVDTTLENNSWETIQKVVKAGKVTEAGWSVGNTKTLTINGAIKTATLIGINHDGENTATFMFTSSIGNHVMNPYDDNIGYGVNTGGFAASDMNSWLNSTAYGLLGDDVKSVITPVTKTNNLGYENPTGTSSSSCKLFLLSVEEVGLKEELNGQGWYPYMDSIDAESTSTYTYFQTNGQSRRQEISNNTNCNWWWLRSADSHDDRDFFIVNSGGGLYDYSADGDGDGGVVPAFVIG